MTDDCKLHSLDVFSKDLAGIVIRLLTELHEQTELVSPKRHSTFSCVHIAAQIR